MPSPDELKKLFKEAADIAAQVPEALREAAFQRALDALLGPGPNASPARSKPEVPRDATRSGIARQQKSATVTNLLESLNRTELAGLVSGRKVLDRALLVLRAAQAHNIDAMSATDIADVLTQKFRESTKPNAVRMALDRSPSYTDRRPDGGSFLYSIMAPGERYLDSQSSAPDGAKYKPKKAPARARPKKKGGAKPQSTKVAADPKSRPSPSKGKKPKPGKTGRPGPKVMLETLISEGFFKTERTMGDIIVHVEEKKTHRYATSDLTATLQRLVRQTKLDRTRNSQGQYEYKAV